MGNEELANNQRASEAIQWLEKAAAQNFSMAYHRLSDIYRSGLGVEPSNAEAAKWLQKASDAGDALGSYRLGQMFEAGLASEAPNPSAALKLYELAAERGLAEAMVYLGRLYEIGARGERDPAKALEVLSPG